MAVLLLAVCLGFVQLFWLYKAFKIGGFLAVVNLLGYAMLNAAILALFESRHP